MYPTQSINFKVYFSLSQKLIHEAVNLKAQTTAWEDVDDTAWLVNLF
jgi:hypothetical protein